jgi:DNA-binding beta-propeller fold protein YncE
VPARAVGLLLVTALAVAATSTSSASELRIAARCQQGTTAAVIDGKKVCLRRGQRCNKRFDRQYHRYGFHCHSARLTGGSPAPKPTPPAGKVVARIAIPSVGGMAAGAGALWVASTFLHTVSRVDPATNTVTATIDISDPATDPGHGPGALAFGHGSLWVVDGSADCSCVHRIDPATNRVVETIPLGVPASQGRIAPLDLVITTDAVWVTHRWGSELALDGGVLRIDPATNRVVAVVALGSSPETGGPTGIAAAPGVVWVGVPSSKSVVRIDPATNSAIATITGFTCAEGQLAADVTGAWVADCDSVRWIDARSNAVAKTVRIPGAVGYGARGVELAVGSLWVQHGPLVRIDPVTGALTGVSSMPAAWIWSEFNLAFGFDSIWLRRNDQVIRVQP